MTRKQIDAARERRLWLTQVVIPLLGISVTALTIPELRMTIKANTIKTKNWFKRKFKKH